jgi:2-dehydro-3-deoxygluconokinase
MRQLVHYADVVIACEDDCKHALGIPLETKAVDAQVTSAERKLDRYETLCRQMFESFPNLSYHAMTLRESHSASHNGWSACLFNGRQLFVSPRYELTHIVDRVGGGDSFAAGADLRLGDEHGR